ncbi:hypothetical protein L873DRAFT_1804948 [Choiromyces venosus 120613-1]|uniref:Uncharacterized protein n=1 Tax=Choiromyces venosus 120613-1 TaxID=1336337 RepID=A0A3N4JTF9_9PEZI|nr:hypothetical protein L873DRAFT_1804948 [Choiromyces venosus 120613-1]
MSVDPIRIPMETRVTSMFSNFYGHSRVLYHTGSRRVVLPIHCDSNFFWINDGDH